MRRVNVPLIAIVVIAVLFVSAIAVTIIYYDRTNNSPNENLITAKILGTGATWLF